MPAAVVVTGATGGIGGPVCRLLADRGIRVYALGRKHAEANPKSRDSQSVENFAVDLGDETSVAAFLDTIHADAADNPVTGAILLASPPPEIDAIANLTRRQMMEQLTVSVAGHHQLLAGLVRDHFRNRATGTVIAAMTRSVDLARGEPVNSNMGGYITGKASFAALLKCYARDYPWLRVGFHSPGFTRTGMLASFDPRYVELLERDGNVENPETVATQIVERYIQLADTPRS